MKCTAAAFTTLCILAPFAASAPTQSIGDTTSSSPLLVSRSENQCVPTGPESCNLWIRSSILPSDLDGTFIVWREWQLFDSGCDSLGGGKLNDGKALGSAFRVSKDQLSSKLRFTINLTTRWTEHLEGYFWYVGRRTDLAGAHCVKCAVGDIPVDIPGAGEGECCRIAFDCTH